jgi:hypothetical protein
MAIKVSQPILIDTDILIDVGRNDSFAKDYLDHFEKSFELSISSITQMELIVGCRNKNEQKLLDKFLKRFQTIVLNEEINFKAISLLNQYRLSHGLLIPDSLIAATAIVLDIPFASKNQKDFIFIDELKIKSYSQGL